MRKSSKPQLLENAKELRFSMTEAEIFVWKKLRNRRFANFKFRRQVPIGNYIADFVCVKSRLIVELDGGQHAAQKEKDALRTDFLESAGYRVLRFWNSDIFLEWDGVEQAILKALNEGLLGESASFQEKISGDG